MSFHPAFKLLSNQSKNFKLAAKQEGGWLPLTDIGPSQLTRLQMMSGFDSAAVPRGQIKTQELQECFKARIHKGKAVRPFAVTAQQDTTAENLPNVFAHRKAKITLRECMTPTLIPFSLCALPFTIYLPKEGLT